jgi:hypothetical protein
MEKNLILNKEPRLIWLAGNGSIGPSPLSLVVEPRGDNVWSIATTHPNSQNIRQRSKKVRREVLRAYRENTTHDAAFADRNSSWTPDFQIQLVAHSQSNVVTQTFDMQKLIRIKRDPKHLTQPQMYFLHEMESEACKNQEALCVRVALLLLVLDQSPSAMRAYKLPRSCGPRA